VSFFKIDEAHLGRPARSVVARAEPEPREEPVVAEARPVVQLRQRAARRPAGRMQTALATAVDTDAEWKDF